MGYALPIWKRAQVQGLKESRQANNQKGRGPGPCLLWGDLDKARHKVPTALLVRVQFSRKDLYKAVEWSCTRHINYSPLNDHCVILLTLEAFNYFWAWQNSLCLWSPLVCRLDHRRRPDESFGNIFLKRYFTIFGEKTVRVWPEELSKCFSKLLISVTLCQLYWTNLKVLEVKIEMWCLTPTPMEMVLKPPTKLQFCII